MRWYGKEITVARGETFSITCKLTNEEGVPYMISSNLQNPTFLMMVSNTLYKSDNNRYMLKCWSPLVTKSMSNPVVVTELPDNPDSTKLYVLVQEDVIGAVTYPVGYYEYKNSNWVRFSSYVNGYIFDDFEVLDKDTAEVPVAHRLYYSATDKKYYIYDSSWKEYETIFVQNFPSFITKDWYNKNFYYELRLVAGEFTDEFSIALEENAYTNFNSEPFEEITDEFVIIPKTQMNVLSRLGGYES